MRIIYTRIGKKSSLKPILLIAVIVAFVACLVAIVGSVTERSVIGGENEGAQIPVYASIDVSGQPSEQLETNKNLINILIIGKDYDSYATDLIAIVALDIKNGSMSTLQIPRDTHVNYGSSSGRINTALIKGRYTSLTGGSSPEVALADGVNALAGVIYESFGIKTDYYMFFDLKAFERAVDVLGGITVNIPMDIDYDDNDRELHVHLKKGETYLDGKQASGFVRYRTGYAQADVGRINATKTVVSAMLKKVCTFSSLSRLSDLIAAVEPYIKTDIPCEISAQAAALIYTLDNDKTVMYNLPGNGVTVSGASYYGVYSKLACEIVNRSFSKGETVTVESLKVIDYSEFKGGYTDTAGVSVSKLLEEGCNIPKA